MKTNKGAIVVLIAVLLPVLLSIAAFTVNLAYLSLLRAESQCVADAAARAGAASLSITQDRSKAMESAIEIAGQNRIGGQLVLLNSDAIVFGEAQAFPDARYAFWRTFDGATNAVRVTVNSRDALRSPLDPILELALGQPEINVRASATATVVDRDIVLVLDHSGSMASVLDDEIFRMQYPELSDLLDNPSWHEDPATRARVIELRSDMPMMGSWSRWGAVIRATHAFLNALEKTTPREKVGLVYFGSQSHHGVNLTFDYNQIREAMKTLAYYHSGRTAIGMGMYRGGKVVTDPLHFRPHARQRIVIMTDGIHNNGTDPQEALVNMKQHYPGVALHTITFSDEAAIEPMRELAEAGYGQHWHADSGADLTEAFLEIADSMPVILID